MKTGTSTALTAEKHIYVHAISRILPTCDISLGSLTSASEAGEFVELILLY
jgi:hypothetical protein